MTCKPDKLASIGLDKVAIQKLCDVFAGYPEIDKVVLFGSRALGTHKEGSDIDICLCGEEITITKLLEIRCRLDDLMLPYKLDTSIYHRIDNQELKNHIDRVGEKVYPRINTKF